MNILDINNVLTKKEMKRFGSFIRSPFFNTEARFIKLYKIIELGGETLTRESIARKMFGEDTHQGDPRFRKLVSEFMKLFERFLAEAEFSADELNQKFMILEKFKKMNLRKEFLKQADNIIDYIKNETVKDELYYRNMADVYAKKYSVVDINFKNYNNDISFALNNHVDKYFTAMKIFIYQRWGSLEYSFNVDLSERKTYYKDLMEYIRINSTSLKKNDPEIYLRYLELKLDTHGYNDVLYNEYLETIQTESINIRRYPFYSTLINILSKYINEGNSEYCEKVIEVAKIMDKNDLYKSFGFSYIDIMIITESAISKGEYDWAIRFTNSVKDYILHENKESVFKLISGKLYFFTKDYSNARKLLSSISISDYIHYIEAKLIECRIEFELKNYSPVLDLASTAKKFLKSHKKIGKHFSVAYNLFLENMLKLVKVIEGINNTTNIDYELSIIEKNITAKEIPIYAQGWLIEKIAEIKKSRF